jgi:hypothetical protein
MPVLIGAASSPGVPRLRMFATAGFRPLWPVIFFLPWLILGIAYLLESVRHRRARAAPVVRGKVMSLLPAAWRRNPATAPGDDAEPRKYLPRQSARTRPDP